jgi:hypothetical protein
MQIKKDFEKDVTAYIWTEAAFSGKFELLDLLSRVEKGEVKKVKIHRRLVPNLILHNTILRFMERHGVTLVRDDVVRG